MKLQTVWLEEPAENSSFLMFSFLPPVQLGILFTGPTHNAVSLLIIWAILGLEVRVENCVHQAEMFHFILDTRGPLKVKKVWDQESEQANKYGLQGEECGWVGRKRQLPHKPVPQFT